MKLKFGQLKDLLGKSTMARVVVRGASFHIHALIMKLPPPITNPLRATTLFLLIHTLNIVRVLVVDGRSHNAMTECRKYRS